MAPITHIPVRDARDRLIDLLGIGETYPLRDVSVGGLTVPFETTAKIPIDPSQSGVQYQLRDKHDRPVEHGPGQGTAAGTSVEDAGNGAQLLLETPEIEDDVTFRILARKHKTGRQAYLHGTATIKVGLDTGLEAWVRVGDAVSLLEPSVGKTTGVEARIVHYGGGVAVEIVASQEGVDYQLVCLQRSQPEGNALKEVELSLESVRGNLDNIVLHSGPLYEDTDIRIRATKTFESRDDETELLRVVLPLRVRANPALEVSVDGSVVIGYEDNAVISIAETQESVTYQLYVGTIPDRDMPHDRVPDSEVIVVPAEGLSPIRVRRPAGGEIWQTPENYVVVGASTPGNGVDIQIPLDSMTDDALVMVQASKKHRVSADHVSLAEGQVSASEGQASAKTDDASRIVQSAIQLQQPVVVLVRPDPDPVLRLRVRMETEKTVGTIAVFDGQPGVFYHFRLEQDGEDVGLPAYVHKRDPRDDSENKGVGQLGVGVDFVLVQDSSEAWDRIAELPGPPSVNTGSLPSPAILHVLAVKAQTRIATPLDRTAKIARVRQIRVEPAVVQRDSTAEIVVLASLKTETYQLTLGGLPVGAAQPGDGNNLTFTTQALSEDSTFQMHITRAAGSSIPVERVVSLVVPVQTEPDAT